MNLTIPEVSLVVLVGPSGSGKSTFAALHFLPTEVVSSDACRAMVSDDENDMSATGAAFRVLYSIATERLRARRLTVVDATNVLPEYRAPLIELARSNDLTAGAIVFNLPAKLCVERNADRTRRSVSTAVIQRQHAQMKRSLTGLASEGFGFVHVLASVEAVDSVKVIRSTA